eukprot:jgi/Picsp_1/1790/NSC_05260-R1_flowering time control protein fpa
MNQGPEVCTSGDPELKAVKMLSLTANLEGKSQYILNDFDVVEKHENVPSSNGNGLPSEDKNQHVTGDNCSSGCGKTGLPEGSCGCNAESRVKESEQKTIPARLPLRTADSIISDMRLGKAFENARDLGASLPSHALNDQHIRCSKPNATSEVLKACISHTGSPVQAVDLSTMSLNSYRATCGPESGSLAFFSPEGASAHSDQPFSSEQDLSMVVKHLDEHLGKNDSLEGIHGMGQLPVSELTVPYGPQQIVPQTDKQLLPGANGSGPAPGQSEIPTRYLWVGNLTSNATRAVLQTIFERFGTLEDLISFPNRMYAFVTYQSIDSAVKAVESIQGITIKDFTGEKGMILKFRPEKKVMPYLGDGISRDGSSCRGSSSGDYDVEPSPRIWLGNIAPTATAANLQAVLGRFGPLVDAAVFPARIGPLGYAFVKFEKIEDAISAYNTLNNAVVPALSGTKQVKMRYKPVSEGMPVRDATLDALQASIPSRHIWIGNVTQKPSEDILIQIFSRFGAIESARVFSAKSYAFVNFYDVSSAIEALTKLDGVSVPVLTGLKPLVMRYQHDSPSQAAALEGHNTSLNSKVFEILAKSRMVPDAHQFPATVTLPSYLQQGLQAPRHAASLQFSQSQGDPRQGILREQHVTLPVSDLNYTSFDHASQISAVLHNLASLQGNLGQSNAQLIGPLNSVQFDSPEQDHLLMEPNQANAAEFSRRREDGYFVPAAPSSWLPTASNTPSDWGHGNNAFGGTGGLVWKG